MSKPSPSTKINSPSGSSLISTPYWNFPTMSSTWSSCRTSLTSVLKRKISLSTTTPKRIKKISCHLRFNCKVSSFSWAISTQKWSKKYQETKTSPMKSLKICPESFPSQRSNSTSKGKAKPAGTHASYNKTCSKAVNWPNNKTSQTIPKNSCSSTSGKNKHKLPASKLSPVSARAFTSLAKISKKTRNLLMLSTASFPKSQTKPLATSSNLITCTPKITPLCIPIRTSPELNSPRSSSIYSAAKSWFWMKFLTDSSMSKPSSREVFLTIRTIKFTSQQKRLKAFTLRLDLSVNLSFTTKKCSTLWSW